MKILYIDDDDSILKDTKDLLEDAELYGSKLIVDIEKDFDGAIVRLSKENYDLLIIDVFRGEVTITNTDQAGKEVLKKVRETRFIPVIFYTGLVHAVEELKSAVVGIVRKSDGVEALKSEIGGFAKSGLVSIRNDILVYTDKNIREFFWDFVENNWENLKDKVEREDLKLLLIRRLSLLLSKEHLPQLLGDSEGNPEISLPMQYYIFPPVTSNRYETGDILQKEGKTLIILTPTCDLVLRQRSSNGTEIALLVEAQHLEERSEYKDYIENRSGEKKNELKRLLGNKKSTLFYLPSFPLMDDQVIDFQYVVAESVENLKNYNKIAKLDSPYAEAVLSAFIRHYNRVGTPDIDVDKVISRL